MSQYRVEIEDDLVFGEVLSRTPTSRGKIRRDVLPLHTNGSPPVTLDYGRLRLRLCTSAAPGKEEACRYDQPDASGHLLGP